MTDLVNRIRSALGTEETGEALVEVATASHRAERELASLTRWLDEDLIPYLEDREDCDQDHVGPIPNEEMQLLVELKRLLGRQP